MRAYSVDLRVRVLAAGDDGMGAAEAADTFAVSEAWVRRIRPRRREAGEVAPRVPDRSARPPVSAARAGELAALVRTHPGRTAAGYRGPSGTPASVVTVWRMLRRLGLTHEKSRPGRPSGTGRMSPAGGPTGGPR